MSEPGATGEAAGTTGEAAVETGAAMFEEEVGLGAPPSDAE
jgi:hypothetical protein